jgi:hypothetical protein
MSEYITPRQNGAGTYLYTDGSTVKVDISTSYSNLVKQDVRSYGPRTETGGTDNTLYIAFEQYRQTGYAPILATLPYSAPSINPITGATDAFINVRYRPDYFEAQANAYNADTTDRKMWLMDQQAKLLESWNQYTLELTAIQTQAYTLDGKSTAATWATALGGAAVVTGNPYAIGAGVVLSLSGLVIKWIATRADKASLTALQARAALLGTEAKQISDRHEAYTKELTSIKQGPIIAAIGLGALLYFNR